MSDDGGSGTRPEGPGTPPDGPDTTPAGPGAPPGTDPAEQRPSPGKRLAALVAGVLTVAFTFLAGASSGSYHSLVPYLLLGLTAVLAGLAAAIALLGTLNLSSVGGWRDRMPKVSARFVATTLVVVAVVTATTVLATEVVIPLVVRGYHEVRGCSTPTEFTVVVSDGQQAATAELLAAFERSTAVDGCPSAHGFVYGVPESTLQAGLAQSWNPDPGGRSNPPRDVGPRPDVWLAESTLPLNRLLVAAPDVVRPAPASYAVSPLVLAVPAGAPAPAPTTTGLSLPTIVDTQGATGVVRPDPTESTSGALATAALYGIDTELSTDPVAPPRADDRTVENRLSGAATAEAYPSGTETEAVCHYRSLPAPRASLLISEQSLLRFDDGRPLDTTCATPAARPDPAATLRAFFPRAPALDHRFVRFTWTPAGSRRDQAVSLFEDWLHSAAGRGALSAAGLRPTPTAGDGEGDIDAGVVDGTVLQRYTVARQRRRDLLAVDVSGSMTEASGTRRRSDDVVDAVTSALSLPPRPGDEIGLVVFPGDATGRTSRPVVPLGGASDAVGGSSRSGAVIRAVATAVPQGNTPLFRTIVDGVGTLAATDSSADRRLVVVTDGDDTSSALPPPAVLDQVRGRGVKVDIVTLGNVSCDSEPLRELGDTTGGRCFDPGATSADLATALGGG